MSLKKVNDDWFYSNPHPLFRLLLVYVKGDGIVLIPLCLLILVFGIFTSFKEMLTLYAVYFILRALGEMIYWLLQQFGQKTYRPDDFGFKNLGNDAIYILYQVMALANMVLGIGFLMLLWR